MQHADLVALVEELADEHPQIERQVRRHTLSVTPATPDPALADSLVRAVRQAMTFRGFVDYRLSYGVASDAQEVLDELEQAVEDGLADTAAPALRLAVTMLRAVVEESDDSSGMISGAGQRAVELYARACREGRPDGVELARWLVRFREGSPGWPDITLDLFVPAFDDAALQSYRTALAEASERHTGEGEWDRFEIGRMRLELADHDGDVDGAIEILRAGERPQYGAIVQRLRDVGREDDAVAVIDEGVRAGRVTATGNDYWLDACEVSRTYLQLGRGDEAVQVQRAQFARRPDAGSFAGLLAVAEEVGAREKERTWAWERALGLGFTRSA
jgi:hypothetical protein